MAKTNKDVLNAFATRKSCRANHLSTDGTRLLSYHWWEVARWVEWRGQRMILRRNGRNFSMTTANKHACHTGALSSIETPVQQGEMNVGYGNLLPVTVAACELRVRKPRKNSYALRLFMEKACDGCKRHHKLIW